jgi:hypothetical protein
MKEKKKESRPFLLFWCDVICVTMYLFQIFQKDKKETHTYIHIHTYTYTHITRV